MLPERSVFISLQAPSFLPTATAVEEDRERFESAEILAKGETAQQNVVYGLTKMAPKTKEGTEKTEERPGNARASNIFFNVSPLPQFNKSTKTE